MYKHVHIKPADEFTCVIFFGRIKAASITNTPKTSITPKPNRFFYISICDANAIIIDKVAIGCWPVIWFRIHFTGSGPFFAMAKQQKQIKKMMDIFFVLLVKREYLYEWPRSLFLAEEMVFMCHIHTPRWFHYIGEWTTPITKAAITTKTKHLLIFTTNCPAIEMKEKRKNGFIFFFVSVWLISFSGSLLFTLNLC